MRLTPILLASLLAACGEKSPTAVVAAVKDSPKLSMEIPDGAKGFASALVGSVTTGFNPTDSDGATFEYTHLQFRGDGTWAASGFVEAMDERMECAEAGSWALEDATDKVTGTINWTVGETSCIGREQGTKTRAQITLGSNGIQNALMR
jgi:hypothetical protein